MEVSLVPISKEGRKTVQEAWLGSGNNELNRCEKSPSVLQCHPGTDPNERDGMSVMAFRLPSMCSGVSGELCWICNRSASARMSCIATRECFAASRWTQCTVGELSLNNAMCASFNEGQTCSMTSHSRRSPAISRSELVRVPSGLLAETTLHEISCGHRKRNTVGGILLFSPMIIPPTP